jgi:hypothetical protein
MEIKHEELVSLLDYYCDANLPLLYPADAQVLVGIELPATVMEKGIDLHHSIRRPIFRHLFCLSPRGSRQASSLIDSAGALVDYQTALKQTKSSEEATELVICWLSKKLAQVLGLKEGSVDKSKAVRSYGIDSLVAIDLKNWLSREIGADMDVFLARRLASRGTVSRVRKQKHLQAAVGSGCSHAKVGLTDETSKSAQFL